MRIPLLYLTVRDQRGHEEPVQGAATNAPRREIDRESLVAYDGSTFAEVKEAAFSGRYEGTLPRHPGLGPRTLLRFFNDSARNLIDRRDVLPRFDKLIHSNGIVLTGVWRIDGESEYTGWFAKGSEGLVLIRASVAGPQIEARYRRAFGIAGKVFPTMDPEEKVQPGNFVTVNKLSGEKRPYVLDYKLTNQPALGFDPAAAVTNRGIFRLMDTRPWWRQLYPISTLGVAPEEEVRTPDLMQLAVADGTPRVDAEDFRDEMRLENYPGGRLTYTVSVKDFDDAQWRRIGTMEFDDYAISEGGDKRIHFWIPRDVPSVPTP